MSSLEQPLTNSHSGENLGGDNSQAQPKSRFGTSSKKKIQLTFENIHITALPVQKGCRKKKTIAEPKVIINDCSGTVVPGQFLAILGASGAGKTTLLNYLSGREISNNLIKKGVIKVNGMDKSSISNFSAISAYVQQDDILFQTMSVRECLEFAAKLKLGGTYAEKMKRVTDLITELRLQKCQYTKIGGALIKGVSGGERKRTSIGVELITDPMLIFLDEPTTGLDSFTAMSVVETMRELALSGRTIVSTIHQPSSEIFETFDRLMLMCLGKIIYFNEARFAVDYFSNINYPCPDQTNPTDYFMSIMSIETHEEESENQAQDSNTLFNMGSLMDSYRKKVEYFDKCYQDSELKNNYKYASPEVEPIQDSHSLHVGATWFYSFLLLTDRNFKNIFRLPQAFRAKMAMIIISSLIGVIVYVGGTNVYTFYIDDPYYSSAAVDNINGSLFYALMVIGFGSVNNIVLLFPEERPIFLREVNNNMYSPSAYFFGKIISELPTSFLLPFVYGSIEYFALKYSRITPYSFLIYIGILFFLYLTAGSYALIIGTLVSDRQVAMTLTPIVVTPLMLFAGYFINQSSIPNYMYEFEYISFFKYGFQALQLNQWGFGNVPVCQQIIIQSSQFSCDPLTQLTPPPSTIADLSMQILTLFVLYLICYIISLIIMIMLSRKYE